MKTTYFRPTRVMLVPHSMLVLFVDLAALLVSADSAPAQLCIPQTARLASPGTPAQFGSAVTLSGDGATAVVGDWREGGDIGKAYVFVRSGGVWTPQGPGLVPTGGVGNGNFGVSASLSTDGSTAVIGAENDNGGIGAAYVFVRSGGSWTQQAKIVPSGGAAGALFGSAVALNFDGTTAVIGAVFDSGQTGAAYIFVRNGTVWSQQGPKITPPFAGGGYFGGSVAISQDSITAIIGAPAGNKAHVYVRSGGTWSLQSSLIHSGGQGAEWFGSSVSISDNGNTAVVGAVYDNGTVDHGVGAVYPFSRSGSVWTQQGPKLVPAGVTVDSDCGASISLSADGNTLVTGAPGSASNAAYLFARAGCGVWTQQGSSLVPSTPGASFGNAIAISADGRAALVGAYNGGGAFVFEMSPSIAITQSPTGATTTSGGGAVFSVAATSDAPLSYQWRRNGTNLSNGPTGSGSVISGATAATLGISSAALADNAAAFDCVISNDCTSVRSNPAGLAVTASCPEDLYQDGTINTVDLVALLAKFGQLCP